MYNDLRYPMVKDSKGNMTSVFSLTLLSKEKRLDMIPFEPKTDDFGNAIAELWERMKGK